MKKIILAATLALSLGACSTLQNIGTAISVGTASIANPVTPTRLNQMESALILVAAGLNGWKDTCVKGLIPPVCKDQIAQVQVYTVQVKPALIRLRAFVHNNDQINAVSVFNDLVGIINEVKTRAAAGGVAINTGS